MFFVSERRRSRRLSSEHRGERSEPSDTASASERSNQASALACLPWILG
jgi:hypothetical protein